MSDAEDLESPPPELVSETWEATDDELIADKEVWLQPPAEVDDDGLVVDTELWLRYLGVCIDGDITELLNPLFEPTVAHYATAVPARDDTLACSITASAHSAHSYVDVYRWEARAGEEARQLVELLHGVVRQRVEEITIRSIIALQSVWRGWKTRKWVAKEMEAARRARHKRFPMGRRSSSMRLFMRGQRRKENIWQRLSAGKPAQPHSRTRPRAARHSRPRKKTSKASYTVEFALRHGSQPEQWQRAVHVWGTGKGAAAGCRVLLYVDERRRRVAEAEKRSLEHVCHTLRANFLTLHLTLKECERLGLARLAAGSEGVSTAVFERCLKRMGLSLSEEQLRELYAEMDVDESSRFLYDTLKWTVLHEASEPRHSTISLEYSLLRPSIRRKAMLSSSPPAASPSPSASPSPPPSPEVSCNVAAVTRAAMEHFGCKRSALDAARAGVAERVAEQMLCAARRAQAASGRQQERQVKFRVAVRARAGGRALYSLNVLVAPPLQLPPPPPALAPLLHRLIEYYGEPARSLRKRGDVAWEGRHREGSEQGAATGRGCRTEELRSLDALLPPPPPPRLVLLRAEGGGRAVDGGRRGVAIDRFVACSARLQLGTEAVARKSFLALSRRLEHALLCDALLWEALFFSFVRMLSPRPLSGVPLYRWRFDADSVMGSMSATLLPLAYNFDALNVLRAESALAVEGKRRERKLVAQLRESVSAALLRGGAAGGAQSAKEGADLACSRTASEGREATSNVTRGSSGCAMDARAPLSSLDVSLADGNLSEEGSIVDEDTGGEPGCRSPFTESEEAAVQLWKANPHRGHTEVLFTSYSLPSLHPFERDSCAFDETASEGPLMHRSPIGAAASKQIIKRMAPYAFAARPTSAPSHRAPPPLTPQLKVRLPQPEREPPGTAPPALAEPPPSPAPARTAPSTREETPSQQHPNPKGRPLIAEDATSGAPPLRPGPPARRHPPLLKDHKPWPRSPVRDDEHTSNLRTSPEAHGEALTKERAWAQAKFPPTRPPRSPPKLPAAPPPPPPVSSLHSEVAKAYVSHMRDVWADKLKAPPSLADGHASEDGSAQYCSRVAELMHSHAIAQVTFPASVSEKARNSGARFSVAFNPTPMYRATNTLKGVASRSLLPAVPHMSFNIPTISAIAAGCAVPLSEQQYTEQLHRSMVSKEARGSTAAALYAEIMAARESVEWAMEEYRQREAWRQADM
ncbi:hypothetical protein AB1Y20_008063 [Prymnesium parvum]|uniref:Uncharacterized protein n=1 Tax=Prymnesium parvum TaxID=97485 RepID=A0AB34IW22_PRYPA